RQMLQPDNRLYPISRTLARFNSPGSANRVTSANSSTPYRDDLFGPDFAASLFVSEPVHNLLHRMSLDPKAPTSAARRPPHPPTLARRRGSSAVPCSGPGARRGHGARPRGLGTRAGPRHSLGRPARPRRAGRRPPAPPAGPASWRIRRVTAAGARAPPPPRLD